MPPNKDQQDLMAFEPEILKRILGGVFDVIWRHLKRDGYDGHVANWKMAF